MVASLQVVVNNLSTVDFWSSELDSFNQFKSRDDQCYVMDPSC